MTMSKTSAIRFGTTIDVYEKRDRGPLPLVLLSRRKIGNIPITISSGGIRNLILQPKSIDSDFLRCDSIANIIIT